MACEVGARAGVGCELVGVEVREGSGAGIFGSEYGGGCGFGGGMRE